MAQTVHRRATQSWPRAVAGLKAGCTNPPTLVDSMNRRSSAPRMISYDSAEEMTFGFSTQSRQKPGRTVALVGGSRCPFQPFGHPEPAAACDICRPPHPNAYERSPTPTNTYGICVLTNR